MAKMSAKNDESKMAKVNAKHEETRWRQSHMRGINYIVARRVRRSEGVKLPHLKKPRDKGPGLQRKDESPKNNGNKFSNTYREDKRKI